MTTAGSAPHRSSVVDVSLRSNQLYEGVLQLGGCLQDAQCTTGSKSLTTSFAFPIPILLLLLAACK